MAAVTLRTELRHWDIWSDHRFAITAFALFRTPEGLWGASGGNVRTSRRLAKRVWPSRTRALPEGTAGHAGTVGMRRDWDAPHGLPYQRQWWDAGSVLAFLLFMRRNRGRHRSAISSAAPRVIACRLVDSRSHDTRAEDGGTDQHAGIGRSRPDQATTANLAAVYAARPPVANIPNSKADRNDPRLLLPAWRTWRRCAWRTAAARCNRRRK